MALQILLGCLIATGGPPNATDAQQKDRSRRVAKIFKLAQSGNAADTETLLALARKPGTAWERSAALQALTDRHKDLALATLRTLVRDPDSAVRTEANIRVYRWTRSKESLAALVKLRDYGSNLRRAFSTGEKNGRPVYDDPRAVAFFHGSLTHTLVYSRLDGALGLIEIGKEPDRSKGLRVIADALTSPDWSARVAAVRYMGVQFDEDGFKPLLRSATEDRDSRVQAAARTILARP